MAATIAVIAWAQLPSDSGAVDPTRWLGLLPGLGGGPGWARAAAAVFVVASLATLAALWWLLQRWAGHGWVPSRLARLTWLAWSLPFVLGPPLASRDVWAYAAQGTLAQHGFDPARVPVSALGPGPLLAAVDPRWRETRPPYGGFAVLLERVGVVLGGGSQLGTVLALRAIAVASVVVMVLGAAQLVRAELRPRTILLIGCNPIVLIHLVSGAHLDAAAAALLVAGLLVADRGHRCAGVALCCLAGTVKFPAFLGAVWLTAAAVHQVWQARAARAQPSDRPAGHPTSRGPAVLPLLARDGTVALGTVVVTTAAGSGLAWLHNLGTPGQLRTGVAPVDAFAQALSSAGAVVGWHPGEPSVLRVSRLAGAAVAMGVALWLVLRPPPRRSDGGVTTGQVRVPAGGLSANALPVGRLAAGLAALALLGPVLYPWYLAPAIALLAIGGPRARQVLIVATLALLAAALPSMRPLAEAPELAFALSLGLLAGPGWYWQRSPRWAGAARHSKSPRIGWPPAVRQMPPGQLTIRLTDAGRWRGVQIAALVAAVAALVTTMVMRHSGLDLDVYRAGAHALGGGHLLYSDAFDAGRQPHLLFTYPPVGALLAWPAAQVPHLPAILCWNVATLAVLAWLMKLTAPDPVRTRPARAAHRPPHPARGSSRGHRLDHTDHRSPRLRPG